MNKFKQGDGVYIIHENKHYEYAEFHRYGEGSNNCIVMVNGAIRILDEDSLIKLFDKENLEEQILIAKLMGYKEASLEEKLKWVGIDSEERLNRMNPMYIPILTKEGEEPICILFLKYDSDYNMIMKAVEKVNEHDWVTIYADSCKIHALNPGEFEEIHVELEGQPMINSIFKALVEYAKVKKFK